MQAGGALGGGAGGGHPESGGHTTLGYILMSGRVESPYSWEGLLCGKEGR